VQVNQVAVHLERAPDDLDKRAVASAANTGRPAGGVQGDSRACSRTEIGNERTQAGLEALWSDRARTPLLVGKVAPCSPER
jgi:hypothetical protein